MFSVVLGMLQGILCGPGCIIPQVFSAVRSVPQVLSMVQGVPQALVVFSGPDGERGPTA